MAHQLAGTLRDPYGSAIPNAIIRFDAVRTTEAVLRHSSAEAMTDSSGSYSLQVETGLYHVRVRTGMSYLDLARNVRVDEDTTASTLNELLMQAQDEGALTPAVVLEVRRLRDTAQAAASTAEQRAQAADGFADSAGQSAQAASSDRAQVALALQQASALYGDLDAVSSAVSAAEGHAQSAEDTREHVDTQRQHVDAAAASALELYGGIDAIHEAVLHTYTNRAIVSAALSNNLIILRG